MWLCKHWCAFTETRGCRGPHCHSSAYVLRLSLSLSLELGWQSTSFCLHSASLPPLFFSCVVAEKEGDTDIGLVEGREREPRIQLHRERHWDRNLELVVTVKPEVLGSSWVLWEELGFTEDSEMTWTQRIGKCYSLGLYQWLTRGSMPTCSIWGRWTGRTSNNIAGFILTLSLGHLPLSRKKFSQTWVISPWNSNGITCAHIYSCLSTACHLRLVRIIQ